MPMANAVACLVLNVVHTATPPYVIMLFRCSTTALTAASGGCLWLECKVDKYQ